MNLGTVGIMPPGALGVSFFYHLTGGLKRQDKNVFFVGLDHSRSIDSLLASDLQISSGGQTEKRPFRDITFRTLADAWKAGALPEVLLVCPNPDQLLPVLSTIVELIETIYGEGDEALENLAIPAFVLSSNGIYFQRVRQMFIEKLEESTLLGRLPDLWPAKMPFIVGHLLRGVTVQTGLRDGSGANTTYLPGPSGNSILAGGDEKIRRHCFDLLCSLGGDFELAQDVSPTRLEFEKAIINLMANLLGMISAFGDDGRFRPLCVAEILVPERRSEARELAFRIFEVGLAVRAFSQSENFEILFEHILERAARIGSHIPSSLQAMDNSIKRGALETKFPPTETWLIDPLLHYARSAGLTEAVDYFEGLRQTLLGKLEKAVLLQSQELVSKRL